MNPGASSPFSNHQQQHQQQNQQQYPHQMTALPPLHLAEFPTYSHADSSSDVIDPGTFEMSPPPAKRRHVEHSHVASLEVDVSGEEMKRKRKEKHSLQSDSDYGFNSTSGTPSKGEEKLIYIYFHCLRQMHPCYNY